ncbi:MAG: hypothetical protein WCP55_09330 [Lentisphaerota bacterium]
MLNTIPVFGWLLSLAINVSLAVPFWICWTLFGIGGKYFYFLPDVYHHIGFWSCVGIFMVFSILKGMLYPYSLISVTNKKDK